MKTAGTGEVGITILLCFLVTALEGFDIQVFGVAAPVPGPQLHLDPRQLGWLFSIGNIADPRLRSGTTAVNSVRALPAGR
jgi:MFS transporter, AAHS family, 3-hydroxyphenylpropionic acid transporter